MGSDIREERVLITGGSGFIGTNLVEHYVQRDVSVLNLDVSAPRNPLHASYWERVDILDGVALCDTVKFFKPTVILHMAARTDLGGKNLNDYAANIIGVSNIIDACSDITTLRAVVFASSRLVCQIGMVPVAEDDYCPTTFYGQSKAIGEQIVRQRSSDISFPWMIVRPTSIWGPWFDVPYKTFFLAVAAGKYIHPSGGDVPKSFGFVGNTVHQLYALSRAIPEQLRERTIYLGDYPPIHVGEMAEEIRRAMEGPAIPTLSRTLLRVAARLGDAADCIGWKNPPLTTFRLNNLLTPMVHNLTPLESAVGSLPYTMRDGVGITATWLRSLLAR